MESKQFPVLVVIHKSLLYGEQQFKNSVAQSMAWLAAHAPLPTNFTVDYLVVDLPLKFKDFGVFINTGDFAGKFPTTMWGLDGIKEQLRSTGLIPDGKYKVICFAYDTDATQPPHTCANWTYPQPLQSSVFMELAASPYEISGAISDSDGRADIFRVITHEFLHAYARLSALAGVAILDDLDRYDKEFLVDAPDGNRTRMLAREAPYWPLIVANPKVPAEVTNGLLAILNWLKSLFKKPQPPAPQVPPPPQPPAPQPPVPAVAKDYIDIFARAIQHREGYSPPSVAYPNGSRSWQNHNPGNFRYNDFTKIYLGATGQDAGGYATFADYDAGFAALKKFLVMCCKNQVIGRHDITLYQFFAGTKQADGTFKYGYAPAADNNDPNSYTVEVAQKLGVDPQIKIKNLLP